MKTCPYCAESIQEEAIKCRYCFEFLDGSGTGAVPPAAVQPPAASPDAPELPPWYRNSALVASFLMVGPLMLPLVWTHPTMPRQRKVVLTVAGALFCLGLVAAVIVALQPVLDLYRELQRVRALTR